MPLHAHIILGIVWGFLMYLMLIAFVTTLLTELWPNTFLKSGFECLTPKSLHKETKLNWFGAIFVGILLNIIYLPIMIFWYGKKLFLKKEDKK